MELQTLEGKEQSCQALLDHDSFLTLPFGRRRRHPLRYHRRRRHLRYRHHRRRLRYCRRRCLRYHPLHTMLCRIIGLHESPASSSSTGYGSRCRGSWGRFVIVGFYPSFLCSPRRHCCLYRHCHRRCRRGYHHRHRCQCCRLRHHSIRWGVHPVGCYPTPLLGWYHLTGVRSWRSKPLRWEVWCWVLILRWFAQLGLRMSSFPAPALSALHPDMVWVSLLAVIG